MAIHKRIKLDLISGENKPIQNPTFDDIIGQEEVVKKLKFYINSHKPNMSFPSMLFTGSHGLGKTYVAKILASNMNRRFLEINCATIGTTKDFVESILFQKVMGMTPITVLFDEAHKLSGEITTILLSLMSPSEKGFNTLEYEGWEICYDLTKINTILATTDSFKIFPPLVNRCETIYFKPYTNPEIIDMLRYYLPGINLSNCSNDTMEDLAYACRGRGRDTYSLAQKIKRQCKDKLTINDWDKLKDIFGIYPMGLNEQELTLMRVIRISGAISCVGIATKMMVREENISDEIEIRPKELWLVTNTAKGRVLTDIGEEYFTKLLKEDVQQSEDKVRGRI